MEAKGAEADADDAPSSVTENVISSTGGAAPFASILAHFLPRFRLDGLRALASGALAAPCERHVEAALLFVDVTGFTRLTEQYARRGRGGAEELATVLDRLFGRIGDLVATFGGDLVGVAGDAALAIFGADAACDARESTRRATSCGLAIQRELGAVEIARGAELRLRAGVSTGTVRLLELGGVRGRYESLVVGAPLVEVTAAAARAIPGELVASSTAARALVGLAMLTPGDDGSARVDAVVAPAPIEAARRPPIDEALVRVVERHVPRLVVERLRAGQLDWLAEVRTASVVFVNLPGLDPDAAPLARLDAAVCALQSVAFDRDGSIYDFVADDKGTTFILAFGIPPHAHADDPARAVAAAIEVRARLAELGVETSIGVTTGRVFSGVFGTAARAHYTMRGSAINLAARLMAVRGHDVLCDAPTARAAASTFELERLPPVRVKGREPPIEILRPRGRVEARPSRASALGREAERARIVSRLEGLRHGAPARILVLGDFGMGKSHLLASALASADASIVVAHASADAHERDAPYAVFGALLPSMLLPASRPDARAPASLLSAVGEALAGDARLLAKLPLLDEVLPLGLGGAQVLGELDASARTEAIEELVVRIARARASRGPLAIVIDDAHWLDEASIALLAAIARRVAPIAMIVAARPIDGAPPAELAPLIEGADDRLELAPIADDELLVIARDALGVEALPPKIEAFVLARAEGSPHRARELALGLRDAGLVVCDGRACRLAGEADLATIELPSERASTGARLDRLAPDQQLVLKAASVIGHEFGVDELRAVYPVRRARATVPAILEELARLGFVRSSGPARYEFVDEATRASAYDLLLLSQRRRLHRRLARWCERRHEQDPEAHAAELARHWERAEDPARALAWLERAAHFAARNGHEREAIDHLRRALELARRRDAIPPDPVRLARWHALVGEAWARLGDRDLARAELERALALLGRPVPRDARARVGRVVEDVARGVASRIARSVLGADVAPREVDALSASIRDALARLSPRGGAALGLLRAGIDRLRTRR